MPFLTEPVWAWYIIKLKVRREGVSPLGMAPHVRVGQELMLIQMLEAFLVEEKGKEYACQE